MFLRSTSFFPPQASLMRNVSAVAEARSAFLQDRFPNLNMLLRSRYEWMNAYLGGLENVIELGCGPGLSTLYLTNPRVVLSDCVPAEWVDQTIDALNMPFENGAVDALICSHMIHHLAYPSRFFREAARVLKPGGVILVQDVHCSVLMRVLMAALRMEGWSYDVDAFSDERPLNDPNDAWSGNNAVPDLLFQCPQSFSQAFPEFFIERRELCECLAVIASGGVTAQITVPRLPQFALRTIQALDVIICRLVPRFAALGQRVVIRRR